MSVRRTHVAAACAALSTAAVAGMVAVTVLAGDRTCDLDGCPPAPGGVVVSTAAHVARAGPAGDPCAAPRTTPSTAAATAPDRGRSPCTAPAGPSRSGGMATAPVPGP